MEKIKPEQKKVECEIQEPSVKYKDSYLSALEEFRKEGTELDESEEETKNDFPNLIKHLKDESQGVNIQSDYVPQTTYWVIDKDGYAGRVSLRHKLNENLLKVGGHIGYAIRPSKRKLGYGEKALALILPKARDLGLEKVLLTCDSTNMGSRKIIEANGGVLENEVPGENGEPSKLRFWIKL